MKTTLHGLSVFFFTHLLICTVFAQEVLSGFSESKSYSPRVFPTDDVKKGKNKDGVEKKTTSPDGNSGQLEYEQFLEFSTSVIDSGGRFVTGLKRSDFTVFVDDKESEILAFMPGGESVNLIILVDTSPSLIFNDVKIAEITQKLVDRIPPQRKLMIIQFGDELRVMTPLTNERRVISKAIKKLKYLRGTSIYDLGGTSIYDLGGTSIYDNVANLLVKTLADLPGREAILLITDGIDTTSKKYNFERSLREVEKGDAIFFPIYYDSKDLIITGKTKPNRTIGRLRPVPGLPVYGSGLTEKQYRNGQWLLNDLVTITGGRIIAAATPENAPNPEIIDGLMNELSLRYLLRLRLPNPSSPGMRHSIKVRVNRPDLIVTARGSYIPGE